MDKSKILITIGVIAFIAVIVLVAIYSPSKPSVYDLEDNISEVFNATENIGGEIWELEFTLSKSEYSVLEDAYDDLYSSVYDLHDEYEELIEELREDDD